MGFILIAGESEDLRHALRDELVRAGHEVLLTRTGFAAVRSAHARTLSLVTLDGDLPDAGADEVCRALKDDRVTRDVPVVIVSDRGDEAHRVSAFELGVEDYVVRPFSVRELVLRIRTILARLAARAEGPRGTFEFGALRIDRDAHRLWVGEREVEVTFTELRLLLLLVDRRSAALSRAVLLQEVWDTEPGTETRTVDQHVKRLRLKLGPAGDYIETVRGVGYRFAERPMSARGKFVGAPVRHSD